MLPLPPLAGLCETVKFLLMRVAEVTGAENVLIRPGEKDRPIGYKGGVFYDPNENHFARKGLVFIPLEAGGWVALYGAKKSFDQECISSYCSQAIQNARTYVALQERAQMDVLTGLPNRVALSRKISEETKRLCKFCVLFIDLNNFKKINDTFGHITGDDILKRAGQEIRNSMRSSDFLARYGGDEFVAVLPETTEEKGAVIALRIKNKVVKAEGITVTFSVGLAVYPDDGLTPESLIIKADQRMYKNKENKGAY
jgi:diguanylate cyclase (GGDEF)-like protein